MQTEGVTSDTSTKEEFDVPAAWARRNGAALRSDTDHGLRISSQQSWPSICLELVWEALALPFTLLFRLIPMWRSEVNIDRARRSAMQDATSASRSLALRRVPTVVTPLDSFKCQYGDADDDMRGVLDDVWPKGSSKLFVLLMPAVVDTRSVAPLFTGGDADFPGYHMPGQPDLRQVYPSFLTDFASIPPLVSIFLHPAAHYVRAAIVHDWAYAYHYDGSKQGRQDCDRAMLELMREDRVPPLVRTFVYLGLRLGGSIAYRRAPSSRTDLHNLGYALHPWFMTMGRFILTYQLRQFEDAGFLMPASRKFSLRLPDESMSDEEFVAMLKSGELTAAIDEAISTQQRKFFGHEVF